MKITSRVYEYTLLYASKFFKELIVYYVPVGGREGEVSERGTIF